MTRLLLSFLLLLATTSVAIAQAKTDPEPKKPHRDAALKSKDDGKFFSEEAWPKVTAIAEKLLKEKGIDLMIEIYGAPKLNADGGEQESDPGSR